MDTFIGLLVLTVSVRWPADAALRAPEGVHVFAMTFMDMDLSSTDNGYSQIMITSSAKSTVRAKVPFDGQGTYKETDWGSKSFYNFSQKQPDMEQKGTIVVTDGTVDVIGSQMIQGSGDAYLALPLTKNSKQFYLASYPSMRTGFSLYGIAAAADACVDIFRMINGTNVLQDSLNMKAGDVYRKYGMTDQTDCNDPDAIDFTGLNIQASQGVAVFSGHECAQIPCNTQFCDHLIEQIPPVSQWGSEIVVPGLPDRNSLATYTLRIVASTDTNITFPFNADKVMLSERHGCDCIGTGVEAAMLFSACTDECAVGEGEFVEVSVTDATVPVMVQCTPACLVTQYGHSRNAVQTEAQDPDPFMMVITPTDHYNNAMSYATPNYVEPGTLRLHEYINYLVIVVATAHKDGVRYDDDPVTEVETTVGSYTLMTMTHVSFGYHKITHMDPTQNICAFAYGSSPPASPTLEAARTSYGFPVAYRIDGDTVNGNWSYELVLLPGEEEVVTTAPKQCQRNEESSIHQTIVLEVKNQLPLCSVSQESVNKILPELNGAICQGVICPGVSENDFVKSLMLDQTNNKKLRLTIMLVTTMNTRISAVVGCKGHIVDYLTHAEHWAVGLSSEQMMKCKNDIESLELTKSMDICSAGFIGS